MLTDEGRQNLIQAAIDIRKNAYAPYSRFLVGAALLASSGKIFTGTNVEIAAYPSGICAERVAVFNAVSQGERQFEAIAVVTSNGISPCGACRQVLSEFGLDIVVLMADSQGHLMEEISVKRLLPGAFRPSDLPD